MSEHLLVVGGQRCGSTYLASLLDAHPEIAMARPSRPEPKVFLSDESTARGLDWYERTYFGHATHERLLGEKSTSYLEDPQAPGRAARVLGEPRILAIVRDPVARAVSNWRFSTDNGFETRPLAEALEANLTQPEPWNSGRTSVSPFAYLERGRYAELLEPWRATFPESTHVVLLEELRAGPAAITELYSALGVDPSFLPGHVGRPVNRSHSPTPPLPEELQGRLWGYFAESDARLGALLGKDLPWATPSRRHADR